MAAGRCRRGLIAVLEVIWRCLPQKVSSAVFFAVARCPSTVPVADRSEAFQGTNPRSQRPTRLAPHRNSGLAIVQTIRTGRRLSRGENKRAAPRAALCRVFPYRVSQETGLFRCPSAQNGVPKGGGARYWRLDASICRRIAPWEGSRGFEIVGRPGAGESLPLRYHRHQTVVAGVGVGSYLTVRIALR